MENSKIIALLDSGMTNEQIKALLNMFPDEPATKPQEEPRTNPENKPAGNMDGDHAELLAAITELTNIMKNPKPDKTDEGKGAEDKTKETETEETNSTMLTAIKELTSTIQSFAADGANIVQPKPLTGAEAIAEILNPYAKKEEK